MPNESNLKPNRTWKKGMPSPNPGGRSKTIATLAHEIRKRTNNGTTLIDFLERIMNDPDAEISDQITAVKILLERGFGKPIECHEVSGTVTLEALVMESFKINGSASRIPAETLS